MRLTFAAIAMSTALSGAASAEDFTNLSDASRAALGEEIRSYLIENPEVLIEVMEVLETRRTQAEGQRDEQLVAAFASELFDHPDSWSGGNPDGDIRLVEFVDYRCGYCKRAHPEISELVESDGNIRIIRKDFPILGEQSMMAAQFAVAVRQIAGDDAYAATSDALMAMRGGVDAATLEALSDQLDLDWAAIEPHMASDDVANVIGANHSLGQRMQINGTPAFVLETQLLRGYLPLDAMRARVEAERDAK